MTTQTSSLAAWLLAQIAEDEAAARAVVDASPWPTLHIADNAYEPEFPFADRFTPARVLAQCAAHRRIVERYKAAQDAADLWTAGRLKTDTRNPLPEFARAEALREAVAALASVYADRDGYDEGWAL